MDKLFLAVDSGGAMPFTDIVMGQPKHDVARTFSALLQLVFTLFCLQAYTGVLVPENKN